MTAILTVSGTAVVKYTYDAWGRLLTTTGSMAGTLGTVLNTDAYSYSSAWGDLLTKYGGLSVTSDTIGNMTGFGPSSYTWEHGRELATLKPLVFGVSCFAFGNGFERPK